MSLGLRPISLPSGIFIHPRNRLATIHQRYRQTDRTGQRSDSIERTVFGRPFVKRFALCYQTVVCLSVTLVYCDQMVGWIKMKLGMQVGLGFGHTVLDWDPAQLHLPKRGRSPRFSAHICCGQMAGWIKMPLGREVGLSPSDIVLDGDPAPLSERGQSPPVFYAYLLWPNGWMDQGATW